MKIISNVTLKASRGKATIARANDVFAGCVDSDFENWGTDRKEKDAPETELAVCELTEDGTFAQIFSKPEEMCLTQGQIVEFCRSHKDQLQKDWYAFFLFKVGDEVFVANVYFVDRGRLGAGVFRFSHGHAWRAEHRRRIVIPQLALDSFAIETLAPGHSDALPAELTINGIKYIKA